MTKKHKPWPWVAIRIETTNWPIPYWIRKIAIKRVDKWMDTRYPKGRFPSG
jgi:hypothetical protein